MFVVQPNSIAGIIKAIEPYATTIEFALATKWSIDNNITGLYHVTNNSSISKNDLLQLFKKYMKKDIKITPDEGRCIDKSFVDTRLLIDYVIPSYDQMISDMVGLIANNRLLYSQYKVGDFEKV